MLREPERRYFLDKMLDARSREISAVSYMEAGMVLISRLGDEAEQALNTMLDEVGITVTPVSAMQSRIALAAFRRYGKGRHPAGLNLGDCFSYALAKSRGEGLLFKAADFSKTDIAIA